MIGQEFGMKQFYESYPKILAEFEKKMNPELPFYYWMVVIFVIGTFHCQILTNQDPVMLNV